MIACVAEDLSKETWNIEHQMENLKIVRTYVRLRDIIAKLVWPITHACHFSCQDQTQTHIHANSTYVS